MAAMRASDFAPQVGAADRAGRRAVAQPCATGWCRRCRRPRGGAGQARCSSPLFGGFLRFYRLGAPHAVVFDETYYVPDAWSILRHGVEFNHPKNINALLVSGSTHILERPR